MSFDATRERVLVEGSAKGDVLYWMRRDQRAEDNWALLRASAIAKEHGAKARVVFAVQPYATERRLDFGLKGLVETEEALLKKGYAFDVLRDFHDEGAAVAEFAKSKACAHVVCDFSPLRDAKAGVASLQAALPAGVGASLIDAHNVVPVWVASDKQEVGARTLRKKINDKLGRYLKEIPALPAQGKKPTASTVDWKPLIKACRAATDRTVKPAGWIKPGAAAAAAEVETFVSSGRLKRFAGSRNDPNVEAASHLSAYLNFGQLSAQRAALRVRAERSKYSESVASFLEEQIVRRELSDNFCHHQSQYDSLAGAAAWARDSLAVHESDKREHVYDEAALTAANTHEDIWNAAQRQLMRTGKMHGFMRMYWAKKILEWSSSPAVALKTALALNDKYSLDGCDPNGYVGVAWSVMGTHDMGWKEREIFGKIRFMNYNGCKRKFKIADYVAAWPARAGAMDAFAQPKKKARKA